MFRESCLQLRVAARATLAILVFGCSVEASPGQDEPDPPRKEVINAPGTPAGLPFSSAVRVGDLLFLSGVIGAPPGTTAVVPGGVGPETRQVLENIRDVVEHAGSSMADVVKCTVFLQDIDEYAQMNEVYATFFPGDPPARSTVAGSGLAFGARVEIECFALSGG